MAANIAKLPELLEKHQLFCFVVLVLNAIAKFGVARTEIRRGMKPCYCSTSRGFALSDKKAAESRPRPTYCHAGGPPPRTPRF